MDFQVEIVNELVGSFPTVQRDINFYLDLYVNLFQ